MKPLGKSDIWICEVHRPDGSLFARWVYDVENARGAAEQHGRQMRDAGYRVYVWQM